MFFQGCIIAYETFYSFTLVKSNFPFNAMVYSWWNFNITQPAIACSKLTKETVEQGVMYVGVVLVS